MNTNQLGRFGCGLWAFVTLTVLVAGAGLMLYIEDRFGAETSAFFLGLVLGIPFLLIVTLMVGGIFVLIIRGTSHLQQQDDIGEIERMRALRELARTNRTMTLTEKQELDNEMKKVKLLDAWRRQGNSPSQETPVDPWRQLPDRGWPDESHGDLPAAGYRIVE